MERAHTVQTVSFHDTSHTTSTPSGSAGAGPVDGGGRVAIASSAFDCDVGNANEAG